MYNSRNSGFNSGIICIIAIIVLIGYVGVNIHRSFDKAYDLKTVTYTVTSKGAKRSHDTEKYLIYCIDENNTAQVLEVTDSFIRGRYDSSDVYAGIEPGKKYKFIVGGSRNSFFSWYPNIYNYEEAGE